MRGRYLRDGLAELHDVYADLSAVAHALRAARKQKDRYSPALWGTIEGTARGEIIRHAADLAALLRAVIPDIDHAAVAELRSDLDARRVSATSGDILTLADMVTRAYGSYRYALTYVLGVAYACQAPITPAYIPMIGWFRSHLSP